MIESLDEVDWIKDKGKLDKHMFDNTSFSGLVFLVIHIKNDGRAEELTK